MPTPQLLRRRVQGTEIALSSHGSLIGTGPPLPNRQVRPSGIRALSQVHVFSTHHPQLPASSATFRRFPFAPRFSCRHIGTRLSSAIPATCSQPTIALRWFSEISELSTVFR